jgi:toxin ParE1/3/4
MPAGQFSYELSQQADNDLQEIFDFTALKFGEEQAIKYLTGFEELFGALCMHPDMGRSRTEIREGARSYCYVSHVVFYRIAGKRIRIVRVLHASRDIRKYL